MSPKGSLFEFSDILQQNVLINPKGSPFYIFRHCATFSEKKFKFFPKNVLRVLSLRYSAVFRRSRLVFHKIGSLMNQRDRNLWRLFVAG